jgi:hypothetical protein
MIEQCFKFKKNVTPCQKTASPVRPSNLRRNLAQEVSQVFNNNSLDLGRPLGEVRSYDLLSCFS